MTCSTSLCTHSVKFLHQFPLSSKCVQQESVQIYFEGTLFSAEVKRPDIAAVQKSREYIASDHSHPELQTKVCPCKNIFMFMKMFLPCANIALILIPGSLYCFIVAPKYLKRENCSTFLLLIRSVAFFYVTKILFSLFY